jgi:nucleotide-binding universal stress UspA family protein
MQIPVLIIPTAEVPAPAAGLRLRVLVPLDGSALAESALVQMLEIARPRPLDVRLVAVVHRRVGPLGALLPTLPTVEMERRAMTRYLHDVAATLRAEGVVTHTDVIESQDSDGRVLLDVARRSIVDVVVMTTGGLHTPGDLLHSRVTTEVLEHSPVPVLLVPSASGMATTGHARQRGRTAVAEAVQP